MSLVTSRVGEPDSLGAAGSSDPSAQKITYGSRHPNTIPGKIEQLVDPVLKGVAMFFYVIFNVVFPVLPFLIDFLINGTKPTVSDTFERAEAAQEKARTALGTGQTDEQNVALEVVYKAAFDDFLAYNAAQTALNAPAASNVPPPVGRGALDPLLVDLDPRLAALDSAYRVAYHASLDDYRAREKARTALGTGQTDEQNVAFEVAYDAAKDAAKDAEKAALKAYLAPGAPHFAAFIALSKARNALGTGQTDEQNVAFEVTYNTAFARFTFTPLIAIGSERIG